MSDDNQPVMETWLAVRIEQERAEAAAAERARLAVLAGGGWRVTALGEQWVSEDVSIPKYVHIYDGERIGQPFGEPTTIRDALGTKFNLDELMGRTA